MASGFGSRFITLTYKNYLPDFCKKFFCIFDLTFLLTKKLKAMSHERSKEQVKVKKEATKTLKEKRAEKKAKKAEKNR
jgi:hypothetical protein